MGLINNAVAKNRAFHSFKVLFFLQFTKGKAYPGSKNAVKVALLACLTIDRYNFAFILSEVKWQASSAHPAVLWGLQLVGSSAPPARESPMWSQSCDVWCNAICGHPAPDCMHPLTS